MREGYCNNKDCPCNIPKEIKKKKCWGSHEYHLIDDSMVCKKCGDTKRYSKYTIYTTGGKP